MSEKIINSEEFLQLEDRKPHKTETFKIRFSPKILGSMALIFVLLAGISVTMVVILLQNNGKEDPFIDDKTTTADDTTTLASILTTLFESTPTFSATESTDSAPTTTEATSPAATSTGTSSTPADTFEIITRVDWGTLPMKGTKKLKTPIERVILMDTQTGTCNRTEDCTKFVKKRQLDTYATYVAGFSVTDIRENFLIAPDGAIYEGRGFSYEGQHSYDRGLTSYNKAVGVSFIGNYTEQDLNEKQRKSFKYFLKKFIDTGTIKVDYKIYYKEQLVGSNEVKAVVYETVKTFDNWRESES